MGPGLTPVAWDLPLSVLKAHLALLEPRAMPGEGRATLMQSTRRTGGVYSSMLEKPMPAVPQNTENRAAETTVIRSRSETEERF